jgi:YgiT-type zinc finger domain-containing protein
MCGGPMEAIRTDLPFKLNNQRILVVKDLPVHQCRSCGEFILSDQVMEALDRLIEATDQNAELEIRRFAA